MTGGEKLRAQNTRLRYLAYAITDQRTRDELLKLAPENDERAERRACDLNPQA